MPNTVGFRDCAIRNDLWQVLVVITARKAYQPLGDEAWRTPAGGIVLRESQLDEGAALGRIIGREPSPAFGVTGGRGIPVLWDLLGTEELRSIALWKMEGYTNEESAAKLGSVARTVERRLRAIRSMWRQANAR